MSHVVKCITYILKMSCFSYINCYLPSFLVCFFCFEGNFYLDWHWVLMMVGSVRTFCR